MALLESPSRTLFARSSTCRGGRSVTAPRSASRMASALWYRPLGSRDIATLAMCARSGETSRSISRRSGGGPSLTAATTSSGWLPAYGGRPASAS